MTSKELNLAKLNGTLDAIYAQEVNTLIRKRYTTADELAILRQRDEKPDEFLAYTSYAEECKKQAKATIYEL